jgi:calpain-7
MKEELNNQNISLDHFHYEEFKRAFELVVDAAKSDDAKEWLCTKGLYIEAIEVLLTIKRKLEMKDSYLTQLITFMLERAENLPILTNSYHYGTDSVEYLRNGHNSYSGSSVSSIASQMNGFSSPRSCLIKSQRNNETVSQNGSSLTNSTQNSSTSFVVDMIVKFAISRAIYFDKHQVYTNAFAWYMVGAQYSVELIKKYMKNNVSLKRNTTAIMDRMDLLKKYKRKRMQVNPLLDTSINIVMNPPTDKEIEVLKETSLINNILYLPFTAKDEEESLSYLQLNEKYSDPMGMLTLSENQRNRFQSFQRPSEFISKPKLFTFPSPLSIRQSVVTNCSFVASLCVAAAYERKFNIPLVTNLIYPQKNGKPVYNPWGKYMVKLHFNAVPRKIIIDDYIPVDNKNNILCTHSITLDLWPTLIEKAYMKLHGGYDFPGSNSAIDLHILTGWYPEQIIFPRPISCNESETIWRRLIDGWKLGACLVTVSTGRDEGVEEMGLESNHAYAVMDVVETSCGKKLLQIKNPWMRKRWVGKYGPNDKQNWTEQLQRELNYDILGALQQDNGIFWIDLESLCKYFAVMHLSWNPRLFNFRKTVHEHWDAKMRSSLSGLDHFTIGWNPQYKVRIFGGGSFWVMLHKHWTSMDKRNGDFITFHVYKIEEKDGIFKRVLVDDNLKISSLGKYINDPHYRDCINTPRDNSWHEYIIVVSQYKELSSITFSLTVASAQECSLEYIPYIDETLPGQLTVTSGEWNVYNCGGSVNDPATYKNNPQYILTAYQRGSVRLFLDTDSSRAFVNIIVFRNNGQKVMIPVDKLLYATSGNYRQCFCVAELPDVIPNEKLTVVVSTFKRDQFARFNLWAEGKGIEVSLEAI